MGPCLHAAKLQACTLFLLPYIFSSTSQLDSLFPSRTQIETQACLLHLISQTGGTAQFQ